MSAIRATKHLRQMRGSYLRLLLSTFILLSLLTFVVAESNAETCINPIHIAKTTGVARSMGVDVDYNTHRVFVAGLGSKNVEVYDGYGGSLIKRIDVWDDPLDKHKPHGIAVDSKTHWVFTSDTGTMSVSFVNGNTLTYEGSVDVGTRPHEVAVNPKTHRVYATGWKDAGEGGWVSGNKLIVIDGDPESSTFKQILDVIEVGTRPAGVAVTDKNKIFVANVEDNTLSVIDGDINEVIATIQLADRPHMVTYLSSLEQIFVNSISGLVYAIDARTYEVIGSVDLSPGAFLKIASNWSLNHVYVSNKAMATVSIIDGIDNSFICDIEVGSYPVAVASDPNINYVYVTNYREVMPDGSIEGSLSVLAYDLTGPDTIIDSAPGDPTKDNTAYFNGTASDDLSNVVDVEYRVIGATTVGWTNAAPQDGAYDSISEGFYFTTLALNDGLNTVEVRATDGVGNVGYASYGFTVDTVKPIVTITSPVNNTTYYKTKVKLSYYANESTRWAGYRLDGGPWITVSGNTKIEVSEGTHSLTLSMSDLARNHGYKTVNFTVTYLGR